MLMKECSMLLLLCMRSRGVFMVIIVLYELGSCSLVVKLSMRGSWWKMWFIFTCYWLGL